MRLDASLQPFDHVALGITGAVGSTDATNLVLELRKICPRVTVLMTRSASHFVAKNALAAISDTRVIAHDENFDASAVARSLDLYLIAPCSANTLAGLFAGLSTNPVTTLSLVVTCPVIIAPSMNESMWNKPVTMRNIEGLKRNGISVISPTTGTEVATLQASFGAFPKPKAIVQYVLRDRRNRATAEYRDFSRDYSS